MMLKEYSKGPYYIGNRKLVGLLSNYGIYPLSDKLGRFFWLEEFNKNEGDETQIWRKKFRRIFDGEFSAELSLPRMGYISKLIDKAGGKQIVYHVVREGEPYYLYFFGSENELIDKYNMVFGTKLKHTDIKHTSANKPSENKKKFKYVAWDDVEREEKTGTIILPSPLPNPEHINQVYAKHIGVSAEDWPVTGSKKIPGGIKIFGTSSDDRQKWWLKILEEQKMKLAEIIGLKL